MSNLKLIICGGGTGGHVFPAIAIAQAVKKIDASAEILFVGANGKMEMEKVPAAGFSIKGLDVVGFKRSLSPSNLLFPFRLLKSMQQAKQIVNAFQPHAGLGVGGYASGPVLRILGRRGIPFIIQEQNSFAGVTNKLLSAKAKYICTAYQGMEKFFPAAKIKLTGNPVRGDIENMSCTKSEAQAYFQFDAQKKTLLVLGGSLGARSVNHAMSNAYQALLDAGYQLIWQCGKMYEAELLNLVKPHPSLWLRAFIDRMDLAYTAADVVVSRAGALSVSEICTTGKACILIPSPNVAEDHQTHNAMALVKKQAAYLIRDDMAANELLPTAQLLLQNEEKRSVLQKNISELAVHNAAHVIAFEFLKTAEIQQRDA